MATLIAELSPRPILRMLTISCVRIARLNKHAWKDSQVIGVYYILNPSGEGMPLSTVVHFI